MGVTTGALLDSTFLIEAERQGLTARIALQQVRLLVPEGSLAISTISVMEMAHGESRADSPNRAHKRERFLTDLMSIVDICPVTPSIARRAGRLDGALAKSGENLAFPDLLIGVTALEHGYSVITRNLRHFQRIPGLTVIEHGRIS
jgi:predicted nucleic acid-binding protein